MAARVGESHGGGEEQDPGQEAGEDALGKSNETHSRFLSSVFVGMIGNKTPPPVGATAGVLADNCLLYRKFPLRSMFWCGFPEITYACVLRKI